MLKFQIEQVALYPPDPDAAIELLTAMGAGEWARDHVMAIGKVRGKRKRNEADLNFEYELLRSARELEVLHYTEGDSWMRYRTPRVSHLGMHCSAEELEDWREFFTMRNIPIAQEVKTQSHVNPVIAGKFWYHYVIFETFPILGVDVKFIVRLFEKESM